jgi:hypothetical protein
VDAVDLDVEIFRFQPQQSIPNSATDHYRSMPRRPQIADGSGDRSR